MTEDVFPVDGWREQNTDGDPGTRAWIRDKGSGMPPYVKPYRIHDKDGYNVVAYPEGTDLGESVEIGHANSIEDAREMAVGFAKGFESNDSDFSPPSLDDISTERSQEIGEVIRGLEKGDRIRATNDPGNHYVTGVVEEKRDRVDGGEMYVAIVRCDNGKKMELHANWRDIPEDADDQETPYTGLLVGEPFDDTAPAVTDIDVLNKADG